MLFSVSLWRVICEGIRVKTATLTRPLTSHNLPSGGTVALSWDDYNHKSLIGYSDTDGIFDSCVR